TLVSRSRPASVALECPHDAQIAVLAADRFQLDGPGHLLAQGDGDARVANTDAVAHQQVRREVATQADLGALVRGTGSDLEILDAQRVSGPPGNAGANV